MRNPSAAENSEPTKPPVAATSGYVIVMFALGAMTLFAGLAMDGFLRWLSIGGAVLCAGLVIMGLVALTRMRQR